MIRHFSILLTLCAGLIAGVAFADEPRLWKDTSGKFQIEATLIKVENEKAYLR